MTGEQVSGQPVPADEASVPQEAQGPDLEGAEDQTEDGSLITPPAPSPYADPNISHAIQDEVHE